MIKRFKSKLIVLLACLAALFLLGGCTLGTTLEEIISNNHLEAQVTYYANKGKFDGGAETEGDAIKDMYYKADSSVFKLGFTGTTNGTATIERPGYDLEGWYFVELNTDGTPKLDADKFPIVSDTPVDFTLKIQKDEHWYIAAKWRAQVKVDIKLVCESGVEISVNGLQNPAKNGDIIMTRSYNAGTDIISEIGDAKDEKGNYNFVEYYEDEDCTIPINLPLRKGETQTENAVIYAKFIDKAWTVVKERSKVQEMLSNTQAGKKYWIARDINMNGVEVNALESFACEVQGNGYTISNLTVAKTNVLRNTVFSFLGKIQASAILRGITFENLQISCAYQGQTVSGVKIYFICESVAAGATIESVAFGGANSKVTFSGGNRKPTVALVGDGVNANLFDTVNLPTLTV